MNKRFYTLMASIMLAGSAFSSASAKNVTGAEFKNAIDENGVLQVTRESGDSEGTEGQNDESVIAISLPVNDNTITLTSDVDLMGEGGNGYVIVKLPEDFAKLEIVGAKVTEEDGEDNDAVKAGETVEKPTFKGHLVLAGENITISNLDIDLTLSKAVVGGFTNNTAITVFADNAIITGNKISGDVNDGNTTNVLNGIMIYPQTTDASYVITGNEISGLNQVVTDNYGTWYSSAFQIYQNRKSGFAATLEGLKDLQLAGVSRVSAKSTAYDVVSFVKNNTLTDNAADVFVRNSVEVNDDGSTNAAYSVDNAVISNSDESASNAFKAALKDVLTSTNENTTVVVNVTEAEFLNALFEISKTNDLTKSKALISVGSKLYALNVEAEGAVTIDLTAGISVNPADKGNYSLADQKTDKFVLVLNKKAIRAEKVNGKVVYQEGTYNEDRASAAFYQWSFSPIASATVKGEYQLGLKAQGEQLTTKDGDYIVVEGYSVEKDAAGNWVINDVTVDGENKAYPNKLTLITAKGEYVVFNDGVFDVREDELSVDQFAAVETGIAQMYAKDLLNRFGEYFTMDITYEDEDGEDIDLTGVFEGNLRPMGRVTYVNEKAEFNEAISIATKYMFVNEDDMILALNTEDAAALGHAKDAYEFELISAREWALDQAVGGDHKYVAYFSVNYLPGDPTTESAVSLTVGDNNWWSSKEYTVYCWLAKGKEPKLVASEYELAGVEITLNKTTAALNPKSWLKKVAYYTVEVINKDEDAAHYGKVLGLDQDGKVAYVDPAKTDISKPEGQFIIWHNDDEYTFTNRENGEQSNGLKKANLYKISDTEFAYKDVDRFGKYHMDTLRITPIIVFSSADGFKRFSEEELNANTYTVAMHLLDDSYLYVVENHDDKHRIGLDREEATNWRIEMPTVMLKDAVWDDVRLVPDTVTVKGVIKYYDGDGVEHDTEVRAGNKKYANPDTYLKICTYILKNTATDEYFFGKKDAEERGNEYYYCPEKDEATRLALKEVGENTVNLVPVTTKEKKFYSGSNTSYEENWKAGLKLNETAYETYAENLKLNGQKVIGGTTSSTGVLKDVDLYDAVSNDLFVISDGVAPTYKSLEQGDKILLSREENNDQVIYEKGEFAGIDNIKAYEINPTVYVDTAYVNREGNYRYEYLLVVNPNRIDETEECEIPSHEHLRTVITEGRFLVNMKDSADANKNVHNNKYMYDGEYKLSFVPGYHQNDTLYFTNDADEVTAKTAVGNAAHNFAKFAFKMINEENNEFVIETGIGAETQAVKNNRGGWTVTNGTPKTGYLRWHNGNLVVTENLDEAEHFTMEASEQDATANDAINASEVSVIAGNGFVTVKGAAGKNVVITNVLGQQVTSTVAASSEATIAAPAGVVFVAVEGEAAVKAIVK
ncbi:DUF6383 domain-containing protein [Parabacteroides sp.]